MRRPPRRDVTIALAVLAAVLAEQLIAVGWEWGVELLKVPGCLALAWRRTAPVASCLVVVSGLGAGEWLETGDSDSMAGFCGILLGLFSLVAYAPRAQLLPGAATAVVILCATSANAALNGDESQGTFDAILGGLLFALVVLCIPAFAIGLGARRQGDLRRRLEEQARALEVERERAAGAAATAERERMAGDLHTVVADGVRAMLAELEEARRTALAEPARAEAAILRVEESGRHALVEMRTLLGVLRRGDEDLALAPQPSLGRLDDLTRRATAAGLEVALRIEGTPRPLAPGLDVAAYRVVEEALAGARGARHADVTVTWSARELVLEVGVDGPQLGEARAVAATRERVALFGGRLDARRRPRGGSALRAELPEVTA